MRAGKSMTRNIATASRSSNPGKLARRGAVRRAVTAPGIRVALLLGMKTIGRTGVATITIAVEPGGDRS
jgi:hypothetical protein